MLFANSRRQGPYDPFIHCVLQIKKLGEEIRVEGMQDHLHIEWSTNTVNVLVSLLTTLGRTRLPAGRRISDAAFR